MKSRQILLLISLFSVVLLFPLLKPHAQITSSSTLANDKQVMADWIKARLKAQIANNNSEAWQRELPTNVSNIRQKSLKMPNTLLNRLSRPLQNYFSSQATLEPLPNVATSENFRINDPGQETGAKVQNNTSSAVSGNNIIVAYNDIGTEISSISYSNDGGETWKTSSIPQLPDGRNFGSGVVAASGKTFYYAGLAVTNDGVPLIIISRSTDSGQTWSTPTKVSAPIDSSSFQDKPWIAVDNSQTPSAGNIYVGWTDFSSMGTNSGSRIVCAVSRNNGSSFASPVPITPLDTFFNTQGVTVAIGPNGEVNLAWGDMDVSGISFAQSTDAGATFSQPRAAAIVKNYLLLAILLNGHFDANGLPSLAVDTSNSPSRGNIYITFNVASLTNPQDRSDVLLVRSTNQGRTWSAPIKLNDDKTITDQFMPSVAVATDGTVGAMWYDRRNDPLFNGMLEVYATTSNDGGLSFTPNKRISNANWGVLTTPLNIRSNYHGDYNQMSALTTQPGFFFNWGDDRSGKDADVYGVKQILPFETTNSFILSPFNPSQTVIPGQRAQFRLAVNTSNTLSISANSDTNTIGFEFETRRTLTGQEILVRARTTSNTTAGTHPVVVTLLASDGQKTSSTLRLNVIPTQNTSSLPLNISQSTTFSIQPHMALDKDNVVYSVWGDDLLGNVRVFFARSTNNGNSFSRPIDVSLSDNLSINPQIAISPDKTINIVWQECPTEDCAIMYSRSTDQGTSFSEPILLSQDLQFSELPSIITNPNGEVVVFWDAAQSLGLAKFEIFASKSSNNGERFSFPTAVVSDSGRNLFTTAAASDGNGKSYLAYESCSNGNCRIDVKRSSDGFDTFTDGGVASGNLDFAIRPALSVGSNGVVYAAMTVSLPELGNRFEIFASTSVNDGVSFNNLKNVSQTTETSNNPAILAVGQQVYVTWVDRSSGNPDIFLAKSSDQGKTFLQAINITSNNTISQSPALVADSNGRAYISFQDEIDGNDETYYLRIDGSPLPTSIDSFSPMSGPSGTNITIKGSELAGTTAISIGGEQAKFFFSSPTEIVAVVPSNASSGVISLTTTNGVISAKDLFTVVNPVITILSPIGKEKLSGGSSFEIKWQVQNIEAANFDLLLSTDSGVTFPTIITSNLASASRMFTWKVPAIKTKTARIALVTRTASGVSFMTVSKANFKIKAK